MESHAEPGAASIAGPDQDWLVAFLRDRDVPCPLCGYNLRGLTSDRCPECGREVRLSVGMADPYLRYWIALAISTFAAAGVGVLFAILLLREGWPRLETAALDFSIYYFLVSIPAAVIVLWLRRRFLRLEKTTQAVIASAVVTLTVSMFAVMCSTIR